MSKSKKLEVRLNPSKPTNLIYLCLANPLYKGSKWLMMTKALEKMEPLSLVTINKNAEQACRAVNNKHNEDANEVPQPGGCLEKLKEIEGEGKSVDASEFTMV